MASLEERFTQLVALGQGPLLKAKLPEHLGQGPLLKAKLSEVLDRRGLLALDDSVRSC